MKTKRAVLSVAALCAAAIAFPGARAVAQTIDMKIGYASVNAPEDAASKRFVEELDKKSGGRIKGRLFPGAQLGGIQRMIEGVQLGTQEAWVGPAGFLVGLHPGFSAPDAPGLFDDVEHAYRSLTDASFREKFTHLVEDKGIIVTSIAVYDPTWIASREPVRRLSDLRGKKIRVIASRMEQEIVGAMGATGVPMEFNEVVPALQNGTIDAVRSSIIVLGGSKAFNVVKSITFEGTGTIPIVVTTSKVWLDKLPADLRQLVLDTGKAYDRVYTDVCNQFRVDAEKLWVDNGAQVIRLPQEDRNELMQKVKPLGDKILGENPRVKEIYELLKASAAKHKKA